MPTVSLVAGMFQLAAASVGVAGYGVLLFRPLATGDRALDAASLTFLFAFLVSAIVLLLGIAGLLTPLAALTVSVPGWVPLHRALQGTRLPPAAVTRMKPQARLLVLITAALAVLVIVRAVVHVWYLPPYLWDSLTYHLPTVAGWIRHEALVTVTTPVVRSYWPAGHELLQAWLALFPHHDALVDAANLVWYVLAVLSVFVIMRSLAVPAPVAGFGAAMFALTPAVLMQSTATNTDIAVAALWLYLIALACQWRISGSAVPARLLLGFAALCLAVGIKPWIVFVLPGLAVILPWCRAASRPAAGTAASSLPAALAVMVVATALLLACWWYARNAVLFGNPLYPAGLSLFGVTLFEGDAGHWQQGAFSLHGMLASLEQLFTVKIFDVAGPYVSDVNNMTGWGWFSFGVGLPATAWAVVSRPDARWLALAFAVSLCSLLAWVTPDAYNMRFAIWFPALFSIAFALFLARLRQPLLRLTFIALATACATLNFLGSMNVNLPRFGPAQWQAMASLPVADRSAAALRAAGLRTGHEFRGVLDVLGPGSRFGYHVGANDFVYPLYGADFSREPVYVPLPEGTPIVHELDAHGLDYLFVRRPEPSLQRRLRSAVAEAHLAEVTEGLYARID